MKHIKDIKDILNGKECNTNKKRWDKNSLDKAERFRCAKLSIEFREIYIFDGTESIEEQNRLESFYIDKYRAEGHPILEHNEGGLDSTKVGYKHYEQTNTLKSWFKVWCKKGGQNYEDFLEVATGVRMKGNMTFNYYKKSDYTPYELDNLKNSECVYKKRVKTEALDIATFEQTPTTRLFFRENLRKLKSLYSIKDFFSECVGDGLYLFYLNNKQDLIKEQDGVEKYETTPIRLDRFKKLLSNKYPSYTIDNFHKVNSGSRTKSGHILYLFFFIPPKSIIRIIK